MNKRIARIGVCVLGVCLTAGVSRGQQQPPATPASAPAPQHRGIVPTIKDRPRHDNFMAHKEWLLKNGGTQLVLLGDSITDGWRNGDARDKFEENFGQWHPYNTGIGGDQTQHLLWRIENGELDGISPKAAMIMIGTNNIGNKQTVAEAIEGIEAVVKATKAKLPNTKILLLAVFPRGTKADDPYRAQIKEINEALAKLDDGGKHVKYLDIGAKFLDADGSIPRAIMADALHPTAKGYVIWTDAVKPVLEEMEK